MVKAVVMGIVEGITEFLPVSSTGHLILAGKLLGFTGEKAASFEIFIQLGAILSIVLMYRRKFVSLLSFKKDGGFSGIKGVQLLTLSTLPALIAGAGLHHFIKAHLFNPLTVAAGLMAGSVWIFAVENKKKNFTKHSLDELNYKDALWIGCAQCLAMWPGVSRSGATILGAMMLGVDRKTATEYSFFAAVPVIGAATILDLISSFSILKSQDLTFFAIGFGVSFIAAWIAVKTFVAYVSKNSLSIFGVYRLLLVIGVLLFMHR